MASRKSQTSGIQKGFLVQGQKHFHASPETPEIAEKPKKQQKMIIQKEVTEFNPEQAQTIDIRQLTAIILDLQKEVRELKHQNQRLQERLDNKIEPMLNENERFLDNIWRERGITTKDLRIISEKVQQQLQQLEQQQVQLNTAQQEQPDKMEIEDETKMKAPYRKPKKCHYCKSERHLVRQCNWFRQWKKQKDRQLWNQITRIY